jgi:hypothetical protein
MSQTLLQLHPDRKALGVTESNWRERLSEAQTDSSVGILHADISGNSDYLHSYLLSHVCSLFDVLIGLSLNAIALTERSYTMIL